LAVILYRSLADPSSDAQVSAYPANLTADEVRTMVVDTVPGARFEGISVDARSLFVSARGEDGPVDPGDRPRDLADRLDRDVWRVTKAASPGRAKRAPGSR
jgi:hypothetical protein